MKLDRGYHGRYHFGVRWVLPEVKGGEWKMGIKRRVAVPLATSRPLASKCQPRTTIDARSILLEKT